MTETILGILGNYPLTDIQKAWYIAWLANEANTAAQAETGDNSSVEFDKALLAAILREIKQLPRFQDIQGVQFVPSSGSRATLYDLAGERKEEIEGTIFDFNMLFKPETWANSKKGKAKLASIPFNELLKLFIDNLK